MLCVLCTPFLICIKTINQLRLIRLERKEVKTETGCPWRWRQMGGNMGGDIVCPRILRTAEYRIDKQLREREVSEWAYTHNSAKSTPTAAAAAAVAAVVVVRFVGTKRARIYTTAHTHTHTQTLYDVAIHTAHIENDIIQLTCIVIFSEMNMWWEWIWRI